MNLMSKIVILLPMICVISIIVSGISIYLSLRRPNEVPATYNVEVTTPTTSATYKHVVTGSSLLLAASTNATLATPTSHRHVDYNNAPLLPTSMTAAPHQHVQHTKTSNVASPTTPMALAPLPHVDSGTPLFLTPLIEAGKIDEAKELAAVSGYFSWVDSYSGFLTVNKQRKSNLFFWYFPPQTTDENSPVILWLQGELVMSSLIGVFCEHGPFILEPPDTIHRRKASWTVSHHLIYIDSPVGTGYSYAEDDESPRNSKEVVHDLHEAIVQLFTLFPNLEKCEFYISGEDFGGKYAISLAQKISTDMKKYMKRGTKPKVSINLAGVVIGNGFVDPIHQIHYAEFLNGIGIIDHLEYSNIKAKEKLVLDCIKNHTSTCAHNELLELTESVKLATGFASLYNYVEPAGLRCLEEIQTFVRSPKVRKALHVGYLEYKSESSIGPVSHDYMESVSVLFPHLLEKHRICIYSGQLDMLVPHVSTSKYLERLKIPHDPVFHNAARHLWRFGDDLAGYIKCGIHLCEVLVRNAGHMAAADQPEWMNELITNFTHRRGYFED